MGDLKSLVKISEAFIEKKRHRKITRLKDKEEKISVLQNSLISALRLKHLNFELKLKKFKDKKEKHILTLKSNLIPYKINLLQTDFNEKDFKKIDSLINKLEEEIANV